MGAHAGGLRVEVCVDAEGIARRAGEIIAAAAMHRPDTILCAATGSSPTHTYAQLVERARERPGLFDKLRVLQLDEWVGLTKDDPGSCQTYLRRHLITPLGIDESRYVAFSSCAPEPAAECGRVADWLDAHGPIDLCVLGLGLNGHIALNEPQDELQLHPHVARLTEQTREHPMIAHAQDRVRSGMTVGVGDILRSRQVLLLVSGAVKKSALQRLLKPTVSTHYPSSLMHLHPNALCLCDSPAFE